jgi:hypothetical protein
MKNLNKEHFEFLLGLKDGADIFGFKEARLGREIKKYAPSWILIGEAMGEYDGAERIPYYGALATRQGLRGAKEELEKLAAMNNEGMG